MGIVDRILGREVATEQRIVAPWWPSDLPQKTAGVNITQENATAIGAVWAAINLYASTIASLPWGAYIRQEGVRTPVARPRWMDVPIPNNPNFTSFDFKHRLISSLMIDGNVFVLALRDSSGNVIETRILDPQKCEILTGEKGEPIYKITTSEGTSTLGTDSIVHIPLFATGENHRGLSPIEHHRVTLGLASATQLFGAKFYEQGATVGGVVKVPGELTAEQAQSLRDGFARRHEGVDRAWRVAVLTGGADYAQMSVKISDLQLVETLHWGVESVARIYGLPLGYLQYPGGNTSYNSQESLGQAWLALGLAPMLSRVEAGLQRLIAGDTTFIKFNTAALLRATQAERMASYALALQNGILTLDEVRTYEDLPRLAVGGDEHWKPLNIGIVGDDSTRDEAETAGVLIRAGFEPLDSAKVAGLPPIKHSGAAPITVQPEPLP